MMTLWCYTSTLMLWHWNNDTDMMTQTWWHWHETLMLCHWHYETQKKKMTNNRPTCFGRNCVVLSPCPSRPYSPKPHVYKSPLDAMAALCELPQAMSRMRFDRNASIRRGLSQFLEHTPPWYDQFKMNLPGTTMQTRIKSTDNFLIWPVQHAYDLLVHKNLPGMTR